MVKRELKKIGYKSSIPIAVIVLVLTILSSLWIFYNVEKARQDLAGLNPELANQYSGLLENFDAVSLIIESPLIATAVVLIPLLISILIYNLIAKKFAINWEVE